MLCLWLVLWRGMRAYTKLDWPCRRVSVTSVVRFTCLLARGSVSVRAHLLRAEESWALFFTMRMCVLIRTRKPRLFLAQKNTYTDFSGLQKGIDITRATRFRLPLTRFSATPQERELTAESNTSIYTHTQTHGAMHVLAYAQVQLMLRSFAEQRSSEGHRRYVQFRNARGQ
jgi:hypothetical protein